jgi:hypothetical protein
MHLCSQKDSHCNGSEDYELVIGKCNIYQTLLSDFRSREKIKELVTYLDYFKDVNKGIPLHQQPLPREACLEKFHLVYTIF